MWHRYRQAMTLTTSLQNTKERDVETMNRKALLLSLVVTLVTVTVLTFGLRQHKNEDTNSPADRLEIYEKYKDLYETYQFNPASFDWGYPA